MNNLVFNTVASELKSLIYAQGPGNAVNPLLLDASGNLSVSVASGTVTISNASLTVNGTVTVSQITAPVTIGNASLTVNGTVTVSQITAPVTIGNASLTVNGTVTVSQITAPVTIGNASLTVNGTITIGASTFTSDLVTSTVVTGTGIIFPNKDISTLKVASIFIYNENTNPVTISLQISPVSGSRYIDDPSFTNQVVPANGNLYMAVSSFAHYIRLQYNLGAQTATFSAYFNAQA